MADAELRNATVAAAADMADDNILPMTKSAAGSGLFKLTFGVFKTWLQSSAAAFPSLTGNAGKVLTVKSDASGVEWDAPSVSSGSSGTSAAVGAHRYWALTNMTAKQVSGNNNIISELEFAATAGGTALSYTVVQSSTFSGSSNFPIANIKDGNASTSWASDGIANQSLLIDFGSAQSLAEIRMKTNSTYNAQQPYQFDLSYSDDGRAYQPLMHYSNPSPVADTFTVFSVPTAINVAKGNNAVFSLGVFGGSRNGDAFAAMGMVYNVVDTISIVSIGCVIDLVAGGVYQFYSVPFDISAKKATSTATLLGSYTASAQSTAFPLDVKLVSPITLPVGTYLVYFVYTNAASTTTLSGMYGASSTTTILPKVALMTSPSNTWRLASLNPSINDVWTNGTGTYYYGPYLTYSF